MGHWYCCYCYEYLPTHCRVIGKDRVSGLFCILGVQIYKVTLIMQHYFIRITLSYNWYSCYVKSVSMNNHVGYKICYN